MRIHANADLDPQHSFQVYVIMIFLFIGLAYKLSNIGIVDTKSRWLPSINDAGSQQLSTSTMHGVCEGFNSCVLTYAKPNYTKNLNISIIDMSPKISYTIFFQDIQAKNCAPV